MYQALIKTFLVAEGLATCRFESTQTSLRYGSEGEMKPERESLPNIQEKQIEGRGMDLNRICRVWRKAEGVHMHDWNP